jgi:NADPH:quinone reductase-like Zn-dependent oxidoreductase
VVKQVFIKKGEAVLGEIPAPTIADNEVLVRVYDSCISVGTELAGIKSSGKSLYRKAMEKPQYIAKVMENIKKHGLADTFSRVKSKIGSKNPVGYSAAGMVVDVGTNIRNIKAGDKVACAGAGIANHAEFIAVPQNLIVKIPENLSVKSASTMTLGSIALQGVRRCSPALG